MKTHTAPRLFLTLVMGAILLVATATATAGGTNKLSVEPEKAWVSGQSLIIEGNLVTMDAPDVIERGRLYLADGKIQAVRREGEKFPPHLEINGVPVIRTNDWVFPGFLNLHTHVPFNLQPLWVAGRTYDNRYEWQRDPNHIPAVMYPYYILTNKWEYNLLNEATLFAEVRALVGGTTAFIFSQPCLYTEDRLVRNIEHEPPESGGVYASVNRFNEAFMVEQAPAIRDRLDSGELRAWVAHLAEGIDKLSADEFDRLEGANLLRKELVIVHGAGLTPSQLKKFGQVGGHLVWSPTSNYMLYGEMADVKTALESGVTVSLSNDWAPSGTHNVLAELKVAAAAYRDRYGSELPPRLLAEMITVNPAKAIGWENRAGRLASGLNADVVILKRNGGDPYQTLLAATEKSVRLVVVGGEPLFGDPEIMNILKPNDTELLTVTGPDGEKYSKRIDVTNNRGDVTLQAALVRLRRAHRLDPADMAASFNVKTQNENGEGGMEQYTAKKYPGLQPIPVAPIFLGNDEDFFIKLKQMKFPFSGALRTVYRPFDQ